MKFPFSSTIYPNTPTVSHEIINNRDYYYDKFFHEYTDSIKAFLERRRIKKSEVCIFKRATYLRYKNP